MLRKQPVSGSIGGQRQQCTGFAGIGGVADGGEATGEKLLVGVSIRGLEDQYYVQVKEGAEISQKS